MHISLVPTDGDKDGELDLHDGAIFLGFPDAWELPPGKDRGKILKAVAEYARLKHLHNWQWAKVGNFDFGHFDELFSQGQALQFKEWVSWLQRTSLDARIDELMTYLMEELDEYWVDVWASPLRIHLPKRIIDVVKNPFLREMLGMCHVIQGLQDMNAFAELAETKDLFCVNLLSKLVMDFVGLLRKVISTDPKVRDEVTGAMQVSDYAGLNLCNMIRKAQTMLFKSEGTLRLFELLRRDEDLSNPGGANLRPYLYWNDQYFEEDNRDIRYYSFIVKVDGELEQDDQYYHDDDRHHAVLEVYYGDHERRGDGYVYAPVQIPPGFRPLGKMWLRWDKPAFFHLDSYPDELESEFQVAIAYDQVADEDEDDDMNEVLEAMESTETELCRMVYMQLTTHYVDILDRFNELCTGCGGPLLGHAREKEHHQCIENCMTCGQPVQQHDREGTTGRLLSGARCNKVLG